MPPVELGVTRIEQLPGLCGAATAQMILNFKGLIGVTLPEQNTLFAEIKQNTGGARPAMGAIEAHDCPSWLTQECVKCPGAQSFTCWCTYPPALEATLANRGQAVLLSSHVVDHDAAISIVRSVDFNLPPAVLVKNGLHWLVVSGYLPGAGPGDGLELDGRLVSEIIVSDPTVGAANQNVAIDVWMEEYLSPVIQCGDFQNLVVVIAATAQTAPGPVTGGGSIPRRPGAKPKRPRKPPKRPPKPPKPPRPPKRPPKPPRPPKRPRKRPRTRGKRS